MKTYYNKLYSHGIIYCDTFASQVLFYIYFDVNGTQVLFQESPGNINGLLERKNSNETLWASELEEYFSGPPKYGHGIKEFWKEVRIELFLTHYNENIRKWATETINHENQIS